MITVSLKPARADGESRDDYAWRRKLGAHEVRQHLRGRVVHATPQFMRIPMPLKDAAVDAAILRGALRQVSTHTDAKGEQYRVARGKGEPYCKPVRQLYESHAAYRERRYAA